MLLRHCWLASLVILCTCLSAREARAQLPGLPGQFPDLPVDRYAAIAFSPSTGQYGYAQNYKMLVDARTQARVQCGPDDAYVVGWVKNGWIAFAMTTVHIPGKRPKYLYGWGWHQAEAVARQTALDEARLRIGVEAGRLGVQPNQLPDARLMAVVRSRPAPWEWDGPFVPTWIPWLWVW